MITILLGYNNKGGFLLFFKKKKKKRVVYSWMSIVTSPVVVENASKSIGMCAPVRCDVKLCRRLHAEIEKSWAGVAMFCVFDCCIEVPSGLSWVYLLFVDLRGAVGVGGERSNVYDDAGLG
jgi:hypothetical protein